MLLFKSRREEQEAQRLLVRLLNQNCGELLHEGPRDERRVNLTLIVLIVPLDGKQPCIDRAFTATTKDISSTGLSLVTKHEYAGDRLLLGIRNDDGRTHFLKAEVRHWDPLAGGFFQLGAQVTGVAAVCDYPGLETLQI